MSFWTGRLSKSVKTCDQRSTFAIPIIFFLNTYFHDFSVESYLIVYAKQNKSGSESSASYPKQGSGSGFEVLCGTALRRLPVSAPPPLLLRPLIPPEEDEREWVRARFSERWQERDSTIFFKFWQRAVREYPSTLFKDDTYKGSEDIALQCGETLQTFLRWRTRTCPWLIFYNLDG